jgi:hypothetical protein
MNPRCEFEYYFRRSDLEKLLKSNPGAKAIIIKNEIKTSKAGRKSHVNTIEVSAYALYDETAPAVKKRSTTMKTAALADTTAAADVIYGCPNPPGCGDIT